jgi:murein DD-endopeptidase MepM/ murein hydrolase activator NlpD
LVTTIIVGTSDTLDILSRRYDVSPATILQANGYKGPRALSPGQQRIIPRPTVAAAATVGAKTAATKLVAVTAKPQEKARLAQATTTPAELSTETLVKALEATGALPTFRWPVRGKVISSYGAKTNGKANDGINLSVPEGTPVRAAGDGVVDFSGNEQKSYGNLVLVRHPDGYVTAYAHASEVLVKRGDAIKRGQIIAKSGQSG